MVVFFSQGMAFSPEPALFEQKIQDEICIGLKMTQHIMELRIK
jgi:hypothetical protein